MSTTPSNDGFTGSQYPVGSESGAQGGPPQQGRPAFGDQPAYGAQPPYGTQPGVSDQPVYGAQPGYGDQPAYGAQPGNSDQTAYGAQPPYGAQPYGTQPYGAQPYGQPAWGAPVTPGVPPASLATAVKLMWAGAVWSVVSSVIGAFLARDVMRDAFDTAVRGNGLGPAETDQLHRIATTGGIAGVVLGALISVALWAWMAVMNRRGRKWARIVATVFGVISLLGGLTVLLPPYDLSALLELIGLAISLSALIFMWKKENTPYYEAMSAPRY